MKALVLAELGKDLNKIVNETLKKHKLNANNSP